MIALGIMNRMGPALLLGVNMIEHDVEKLWHEMYDSWGWTLDSFEQWMEDYEALAIVTSDVEAYEEMLKRALSFHDGMMEEELADLEY
jgi:hypothetical protein